LNLILITDPEKLRQIGWSSFVDGHPEGTVFQSPEMYELFSHSRYMDPVVVGIADKRSSSLTGLLMGVTIREMKGLAGYFSSRTVIYGGPLIDPHTPDRKEILHMMLGSLISQVRNHSIFIQFRNFSSQAAVLNDFESSGFYLRDRLNLIVDTSSRETVINNMSESRWRQVRKGLGIRRLDDWEIGGLDDLKVGRSDESKNGHYAKIIRPDRLDQVRDFYDILYDLYKYKVRKPLPSWEFFEQFYRISIEGKLGVILLVQYQEKIIGGILAPVTPGKTIYEWYVCGLDQQYKGVYPSVLATWAALNYAVKNNIPNFDFMGVGIPEREYGVRDFKARFGGKMVNYGRFARINNKAFYAVAELGYNFLSWIKKI
jgi:serine/alanine adding enzyme